MSRKSCPRYWGFVPTRVVSVDVAEGLPTVIEMPGYHRAMVVVKAWGVPAGFTHVEFANERLTAADIRPAIEADWALSDRLSRLTLRRWLMQQQPLETPNRPSYSVIVCTRDRVGQLARCLESIMRALTGPGEVIVVDNDPPNEATKELVARHPQIRYVREMRRGLNWARTAGAHAAHGDILIYTDDDVVVDERWIAGMLDGFSGPRTAAVTGLTLPYEVETYPQALFEYYGGHGRGFARRVFDYTVIPPAAAGMVGSGANMAIRRSLVLKMGLFESEMDVGTAALSGGDAYAMYQLLAKAYQVVYTPDALVWHQHRRDYASLKRMLHGYSVGGYAFLTRCLFQHSDWQAIEVALSWFKHHHLRQMRRCLLRRPDALPLDLILTEWRGALLGPIAYFRTRKPEVERHRAAQVSVSEAPA